MVSKNGVWSKVLTLSAVLFFLFLADAVLSFWAPNLFSDLFKSPIAVGFLISFNSVVGLVADLVFPQIFKSITVAKLLSASVVAVIVFALLLVLGINLTYAAIFLLAVGVWGLYYEFFGFSSQQFIADTVPFKLHSSSWAFLGVFKNLAYFLGPMLAGWFIARGTKIPAWGAIFFALIAGVLLILSRKIQKRPVEIDFKEINLAKEFEHLITLAGYVWPVVVISLIIGIIDSFFWTTGAIWTEKLLKESFWGGFLLPAYQLPSLFVGLVIAKKGIFQGKKKLAEMFLLLAGVFLALLGLVKFIPLIILLVFASSAMLAVTYPMTDAVYSDLVARLGRKRNHLIGLSGSVVNLAYIIGPILAGFLVAAFGEKSSFVAAGVATFLVAIFLLLYTPKKLRLPQGEIQSWKD